jgi:D-ala-D-ala dipeptidase
LLRKMMASEGFTVYEAEWWHFDYQDWQKYRIGNVRFEEIGSSSRGQQQQFGVRLPPGRARCHRVLDSQSLTMLHSFLLMKQTSPAAFLWQPLARSA